MVTLSVVYKLTVLQILCLLKTQLLHMHRLCTSISTNSLIKKLVQRDLELNSCTWKTCMQACRHTYDSECSWADDCFSGCGHIA